MWNQTIVGVCFMYSQFLKTQSAIFPSFYALPSIYRLEMRSSTQAALHFIIQMSIRQFPCETFEIEAWIASIFPPGQGKYQFLPMQTQVLLVTVHCLIINYGIIGRRATVVQHGFHSSRYDCNTFRTSHFPGVCNNGSATKKNMEMNWGLSLERRLYPGRGFMDLFGRLYR